MSGGTDLQNCCQARGEDAAAHDLRNGTRASVEACVSRLLAMTDLWHDQPRLEWPGSQSSLSMLNINILLVLSEWTWQGQQVRHCLHALC